MTVSERIIEVLNTHLHCTGNHCFPSGSDGYSQMLDALEVCLPQPSRERLKAIFEYHDHQYPTRQEWLQAIQTALMAWAQGVEGRKEWCQHCRYVDGEWKGQFPIDQHSLLGSLPNWVKVCPICATKRPEGA